LESLQQARIMHRVETRPRRVLFGGHVTQQGVTYCDRSRLLGNAIGR
jgi:hypothetical protein